MYLTCKQQSGARNNYTKFTAVSKYLLGSIIVHKKTMQTFFKLKASEIKTVNLARK